MKGVFIGTGIIGAGLAANAATNGIDVTMVDVVPVEQIKANLKKVLDILVEAGAINQEKADATLEATKYSTDVAGSVVGADFVQECVPERLDLKQATYKTIQEVTGPDTLIFSSTSAMMPSVLSEGALYPQSIMVGHPYNPSYLLPLIEVCGPHCPAENIAKAKEIYKAMGKVPVEVKKEIKGFAVNRLSWAAMDAAYESVLSGICSVEDMDNAIIYGPGMRMAITGQILTIGQGVQGGYRNFPAKYGFPPEEKWEILAQGCDEQIANRPAEQGNTPEDIDKFRDKCIVEILKLHGKL